MLGNNDVLVGESRTQKDCIRILSKLLGNSFVLGAGNKGLPVHALSLFHISILLIDSPIQSAYLFVAFTTLLFGIFT